MTLEGIGYHYSLFEVRDADRNLFTDDERGVYLRSCFNRYVRDDMSSVAVGAKTSMLQIYTVADLFGDASITYERDGKRYECIAHQVLDENLVDMWIPSERLMLCRRSQDLICSRFEIELSPDDKFDPSRISMLRCQPQWHKDRAKCHITEYAAAHIMYDGKWLKGTVYSRSEHTVDYFVAWSGLIDARHFETWHS